MFPGFEPRSDEAVIKLALRKSRPFLTSCFALALIKGQSLFLIRGRLKGHEQGFAYVGRIPVL